MNTPISTSTPIPLLLPLSLHLPTPIPNHTPTYMPVPTHMSTPTLYLYFYPFPYIYPYAYPTYRYENTSFNETTLLHKQVIHLDETMVLWAPDFAYTICMQCSVSFQKLLQKLRHHCRLCGCDIWHSC